ncbi:MAG: F0F1 ATP synthase subunit delta [Spirochaetaceae bacterium]|jgi:F-type H+-transporting ATPase subunit delta|nr:F0F1 ATP synthase subunit delta [Spirochaetaceae bacterium]
MFIPERWAEAFINASGAFVNASGALAGTAAVESAAEGLAVLKAVLPLLRGIPGEVSGRAAALRLEGMLRAAAAQAAAGESPGTEAAIRLLVLLVKKDKLRFSGSLIGAIEKITGRQRGVLECVLESANPPEEAVQKELKQALKTKTGAKDIRLLPRVRPELLGGFRLRLGDEILDASLRGQLGQMAADLAAGPVNPEARPTAGGI